jgi:broad specificity phosphatase PhoE
MPAVTGLGRAELESQYPRIEISLCAEEWDYEVHSTEEATQRAERVRQKLQGLMETHGNIALFSHTGFISFLVQCARFKLCGKWLAHCSSGHDCL